MYTLFFLILLLLYLFLHSVHASRTEENVILEFFLVFLFYHLRATFTQSFRLFRDPLQRLCRTKPGSINLKTRAFPHHHTLTNTARTPVLEFNVFHFIWLKLCGENAWIFSYTTFFFVRRIRLKININPFVLYTVRNTRPSHHLSLIMFWFQFTINL